MSAVDCECGHAKSDHVLLSRECRNPDPVAEDCVCTKFRAAKVAEPDWDTHRAMSRGERGEGAGPCVACGELWPCTTERGRVAAAKPPSVGWEPPVGLGEKLIAATKRFGEQLDYESTSARLARVTAERDEALAKRDQAIENGDSWMRTAREAQSLAEGFRRTIAELTAERDEMVQRKARVERDLGAQLAEVRERLADLTVAARKSDAKPVADVVTAYDCLYCRTCYGRYFDGTDAANNHEHPLVPVNVTITLREGHR